MGGTIRKLVFQPPQVPSYHDSPDISWVEWSLNDLKRVRAMTSSSSVSTPSSPLSGPGNVGRIPLLFIPFPGASLTILYSHGNACDLGDMASFLVHLSQRLGVHVAAYDYTGYGLTNEDGVDPNESIVFANAIAVKEHLEKNHGVKDENLILFGCSMGSGPSCFLASKFKVRGLLLQTPFMSIVKTQVNSLPFRGLGLDFFENYRYVPHVSCPVLVIHGTHDRVVPFSNGQQLLELVPQQHRYKPLWVPEADHNDIMAHLGNKFFDEIQAFVTHCERKEKS